MAPRKLADTANPAPPSRLAKLATVKAMTALSKSGIYLRIAAGEFPRPVALGARAVAWRLDEVEAWITARPVAVAPAPAAAVAARRASVARRRAEQQAAP